MVFNSDKKDSVLYSDKVSRLKFAPSLSHFGGKPVTGWLAVTATGLVSTQSCCACDDCIVALPRNVSFKVRF